MLKKWPSKQLGICHDLYISSDEELFNKILPCPNHILRTFLPPPTAQNYSLRPHNRQLPESISRITYCNFTVRMLYSKYVLTFIYFRPALFIFVFNCGLTVRNKRICYVLLFSFVLQKLSSQKSQVCFVPVILKVLLVNLLAALNSASVFKNKKTFEKNVKP